MNKLRQFRITRAMAVRMAADAVMINVALLLALWIRFLYTVVVRGHDTRVAYEEDVLSYVTAYIQNSWLLTLVCISVFATCGFYTYGRAYQGRYKALVILQAVTQSYLVFGVLSYLFWERLYLTEVPRGALLLAWVFTLGLTLSSRTWTFLWEQVVRPEREAHRAANGRPIRHVLVIGGAGYIGSALLPKLLDKGYHVRVLDLFLYGTEPLARVAGHSNLQLVKGDFRDVQKVVESMHGMDAVIHLGAIVGDPACNLDGKVTLDVNLSATQMIAQVAKASGIHRFIFASTCSVYGACDELLDERSEVKPISLYGKTKLAAEHGLQRMADEGFAPTILRFGTIYGLSGRTRFDLVINLLTAKAKIEGQITVDGGDQWRPFVHVDDAATAVLKVLQAPLSLVGNDILNVGSDEQNYTIRQVGEMVHEQVFTAELVVRESATDLRNYRVSFAKLCSKVHFKPKWTVEKGIQQVIEAIASGDVEDYRDAKYSNVMFLRESGAIEIVRTDDDWAVELLRPSEPAELAAS